MSFKVSSDVRVKNNLFKVTTTTRHLFFFKPHSVVIPQLLDGGFTLQRGFAIEFTTSETEVLQEWHDLLCRMVEAGKFDIMMEQARIGLFPFDEDDLHLMVFVNGFRCS